MLEPLAENILTWTATVPSRSRAGVTYAHNGFVLALSTVRGVVLVDAPTLTDDDAKEVERLGTPTHVLLTCEWHTRAAEQHRARWGCRVLMHEAGVARAEIPIDGIGFGHGTPTRTNGHAAAERCLRSEMAWLASGGREGDPSRLAAWSERTLYERYEAVAQERASGIPALDFASG